MVDKKTFAIGFIVAFGLLTYYLWQNNESVASTIANNGLDGIFWYFISNPAYVLLLISIYMLNKDAGALRNIGGTLMILFASDIVSYPRLPESGFPNDLAILASSDGIVMNKLIEMGFSYSTSWNFFYLVLPISLMLGALAVLGIHNFFKQVMSGKQA